MQSEQSRYQVRFEWAFDGARAISQDAHVIIWVDAIYDTEISLDVKALPQGPAIITTDLRTAPAAAQWAYNLQLNLGTRIIIAVVAAGAQRDGLTRFAAEDFLTAGAVIDHLAELGLDGTSPEAATAEAAYRGLSRATSHLFSAVTRSGNATTEESHYAPDFSATLPENRVLRNLQ